jgi:hypothetical protein
MWFQWIGFFIVALIVLEGINFAKDYKKYSYNKNILMGKKHLK